MLDVYIKSISYYIPSGRINNNDILKKFEKENKKCFSQEELEFLLYGNDRKFDFLGINTRSFCKNSEDNAVNMAIKAAQKALKKADLQSEQIDCIIFSGVSNPFREPSFATVLAYCLNIGPGANFFDINDTCNGFMKSIEIASLYLKTGKYKNILIITSENPYEVAHGLKSDFELENPDDIDNRFPSFILGSGAAAMILSLDGCSRKIKEYAEKREYDDWDASLLAIPNVNVPSTRFGTYNNGFWSDARCISSAIIKNVPDFIRERLKDWNVLLESIDFFFLHQLGNNVTYAILKQLNVDYKKAPLNTFKDYGNIASANIPICLAMAEEKGLLKSGDSILLVSSACGLLYSLVYIEW